MATATLLPLPRAVFYDPNGAPLEMGFVYTYVPGGTTPKLTWQDAGETTPNANPVPLDANGSCLLYGSGNYQLTVTDSLGNQVPAYSGLTVDTLSGVTSFGEALASQTAPSGATLVGYLASAAGAVGETLQEKLDQFKTVVDFGAVGDGTTDDTTAIQAALNSGLAIFPRRNYYVAGALTAAGDCSILGADATLLGPTSGTATMLTISAINNGTSAPFGFTHVAGLRFQVRGGYAALSVTNTSLLTQTVEAGPLFENLQFSSWGYTSVGTAYLTALNNLENGRFINCSWVTFSSGGAVGINNALQMLGCANCTFTDCQWNYTNVAITMGNSGSQITQGIRVIGCSGNGNNTTLISSNTNDCEFTGCLFDNHLSQAFESVNDLGLSIDDCYIGSSFATGPIIAISCTSGNVNQQAKITSSKIVQYVASSATAAVSVSGVSGTFYNGFLVSDTEFRNCQLFANVVGVDYVANSGMSNCEFNGTPTGVPVAVSNPPTATTGFHVVGCAALNPHGYISGSGPYGAPTALTVVGTNTYYQSPYPFDCMVYVTGGTVTGVQVSINGTAGNLGTVSTVYVPQGAQILVGFTGTPTWIWFGM
jgi:hypothetical protein